MVNAGVTVGLGTDGVSAAGDLNLHRQVHLVAGLFKDARLDPEQIGAKQALRMATIDGAKAPGWAAAIVNRAGLAGEVPTTTTLYD